MAEQVSDEKDGEARMLARKNMRELLKTSLMAHSVVSIRASPRRFMLFSVILGKININDFEASMAGKTEKVCNEFTKKFVDFLRDEHFGIAQGFSIGRVYFLVDMSPATFAKFEDFSEQYSARTKEVDEFRKLVKVAGFEL